MGTWLIDKFAADNLVVIFYIKYGQDVLLLLFLMLIAWDIMRVLLGVNNAGMTSE